MRGQRPMRPMQNALFDPRDAYHRRPPLSPDLPSRGHRVGEKEAARRKTLRPIRMTGALSYRYRCSDFCRLSESF